MKVIGVGNPFRRDDGIGPYVIEALREAGFNEVLDGGTDAMALLDTIRENSGPVVIVDAVNMRREAGSIEIFRPEEAKVIMKGDSMSTHGFGLAEMLELLRSLEIEADITLVGMQPADVSFGEGFSKPVEEKIDELVEMIRRKFLCSVTPPL